MTPINSIIQEHGCKTLFNPLTLKLLFKCLDIPMHALLLISLHNVTKYVQYYMYYTSVSSIAMHAVIPLSLQDVALYDS